MLQAVSHHHTHDIDVAYSYRCSVVSLVVCVCVCVCVCVFVWWSQQLFPFDVANKVTYVGEPCKTAESIEMSFGV